MEIQFGDVHYLKSTFFRSAIAPDRLFEVSMENAAPVKQLNDAADIASGLFSCYGKPRA
jgi:hypothetical protein